VSYLHLQDYQKSYKYLKQCIEQDEQNELSFCKSQELALQTSDSSSDVLNNLGIVCEQLGKLEESIKYY
jgi:Tfp pilus assembly protein PilF